MQLDQLRYFVAVAGELHFRRAAERLHISQPPLSFHIKALEREVGTQLLNRNTRQVSLTEAGAAFLVRARRILSDVAEATEEVKRISTGRAGSLRIGFTISTSFHPFFCDSVFRYRRAYPEVTVSLSENVSERQIDVLLEERLDVGFLRGRFDQVAGLTMSPAFLHPAYGPNRSSATRQTPVWEFIGRSLHFAREPASSRGSCRRRSSRR